ncbi:nucleoporin p54-like isoform X1 [Varroa jacobsoni]|uniref:Nucleoporin Nup54 alpha-helical domain-containing protein n=1 Tax=Varroa destructor TaxID=109461 RepID=A0A7M7J7H2_VARDE|nr:nucleoporin p54-like isoform X2 [Varroa destructor]XP_022688320.1 nucleoporin p54-like isoform X1 [Varroa jacobsoni]
MFGSITGGFGNTSTFGTGFGTSTPATSTGITAFGSTQSGFGAPRPAAPFGNVSNVFGTPTQTPGTTGFGMAAGIPATTTSSGFGVFGQGAPSLFSGGNPTPFSGGAVPGIAGFNTSGTATNQTSGFSFTAPNPNAFQVTTPSGNYGAGFGQSGFGLQQTPQSNTFGINAGVPLPTPQQTAQMAAQAEAQKICLAVSNPGIYNDERDKILAKFNTIQSKWGVGKGFIAQSGPPIDFTPNNPFCKFKAIAYNALPTNRPEEGLVSLMVNKKAEDIKQMTQPSFSELLHKEVIKLPEYSVFIDSVTDIGNSQCNVVIYVLQKFSSGQAKRMVSTDLLKNLENPNCKNALTTLGVVNMAEKTEFNKTLLDQYLAIPPNGIDQLLWEQAKSDNPDPKRMVPVPIIGFEDLKRRMDSQQALQAGQMDRLQKMAREAEELEKRCEQSRARVDEFRSKQQNLSHRVLTVMVAFEINRKIGLGIQADEETLKASLEDIMNEMDHLNRGKLNELQASVKSVPRDQQSHTGSAEPVSEEVNQLLAQQHRGITDLIKVIKEDMKKLDDIKKTLVSPSPNVS